MQKLSHEGQFRTSSDEEGSSLDFEGHNVSHCDGCHITGGAGHQCGIHGYGGAPLQGKAIYHIRIGFQSANLNHS